MTIGGEPSIGAIQPMAVDLSHLGPKLAKAVRRGRDAHPTKVSRADDREPWSAEAGDAVRRGFEDGSFRAAMADIEAVSPGLVLE